MGHVGVHVGVAAVPKVAVGAVVCTQAEVGSVEVCRAAAVAANIVVVHPVKGLPTEGVLLTREAVSYSIRDSSSTRLFGKFPH